MLRGRYCSPISTKFGVYRQIFINVPNIKSFWHPSGVSCADTCKRTWFHHGHCIRLDFYKLTVPYLTLWSWREFVTRKFIKRLYKWGLLPRTTETLPAQIKIYRFAWNDIYQLRIHQIITYCRIKRNKFTDQFTLPKEKSSTFAEQITLPKEKPNTFTEQITLPNQA